MFKICIIYVGKNTLAKLAIIEIKVKKKN